MPVGEVGGAVQSALQQGFSLVCAVLGEREGRVSMAEAEREGEEGGREEGRGEREGGREGER